MSLRFPNFQIQKNGYSNLVGPLKTGLTHPVTTEVRFDITKMLVIDVAAAATRIVGSLFFKVFLFLYEESEM